MKVFCLPFAGGNKYSYRFLEQQASTALEFITLEYPGRAARINESLIYEINELVDCMYRDLSSLMGNENYALYGHSMGGHVAWLLAKKAISENAPVPEHVFVSGTPGPAASLGKEKKRHLLSKGELIEELRALQGSKDELLADEDWLAYFEPILRADFQVSETFEYTAGKPLTVPFTVITGSNEDIDPIDIHTWQQESAFPVDFKEMMGNHFFIYDHPRALMNLFQEKLFNHKSF